MKGGKGGKGKGGKGKGGPVSQLWLDDNAWDHAYAEYGNPEYGYSFGGELGEYSYDPFLEEKSGGVLESLGLAGS